MNKIKNKYLTFDEIKTKGKTKKFEVWNEKEYLLGEVKWFPSWRRYCYYNLSENTWYDSNCLEEIATFLDKLNKEHKKRKQDETK